MPKSYPTDVKTAVVAQVQSGDSVATVSTTWSVPKRTVRKWDRKAKNGQPSRRRGARAALHTHTFALGMFVFSILTSIRKMERTNR
jgi:transposase-like protein